MDDVNNANENDHQEITEQQQIADVVAADRRHLKMNSVLERKGKFPLRNRIKIDLLIKHFLENLEDDVYNMIFDSDIHEYHYDGLDSERDTEEEVETAIRFFPELLSRKGGRYNVLPIQNLTLATDEHDNCVRCNQEGVHYIPLFARLALEFGSFEEEARGGLLYENGNNVIQNLIELRNHDCQDDIEDTYLQIMIRLRRIGLFKKEDIRRYDLLNYLCVYYVHFPKKRLTFLIEWDPTALTQTCPHKNLPLHYATLNNKDNSTQGFQFVFDYGIKYYPRKNGIRFLFKKDRNNKTAFQDACELYGTHEVVRIIEYTLTEYSDTPICIKNTLISAAHEENIHLDCLYFLLRREPDVIQKLLSRSIPVGQKRKSR
jgi:hypothetical protein